MCQFILGKHDESERKSKRHESERYRSWSNTPSIRFQDAPWTPNIDGRETPSR